MIPNPEIKEAIRALCRISFVRHDERIAWRAEDLIPTADHTIALNAVLQEVLRTRLEETDTEGEWNDELRRLALHVNHWLSAALNNQETTKSHQLAPHAAALLAHLQRLGVISHRIALLTGHLGSIYISVGRVADAIELFRSEVNMIRGDAAGPDEFLESQARLHLARALINSDRVAELDTHPAVAELAHVLSYAQGVAINDETQPAAARFCVEALALLTALDERALGNDKSRALATVFRDLKLRLPTTDYTETVDAIQRVSVMLSEGEDAEAERITRDLFKRQDQSPRINTELRRLLVESLVKQRKWSKCRVGIGELANELGCLPLSPEASQQALHNIALELVVAIFDTRTPEPQALLRYLLSQPCFVHAIATTGGEYGAKFAFFELLVAIFDGQADGIREGIYKVESDNNRHHLMQNFPFSFLVEHVMTIARSMV